MPRSGRWGAGSRCCLFSGLAVPPRHQGHMESLVQESLHFSPGEAHTAGPRSTDHSAFLPAPPLPSIHAPGGRNPAGPGRDPENWPPGPPVRRGRNTTVRQERLRRVTRISEDHHHKRGDIRVGPEVQGKWLQSLPPQQTQPEQSSANGGHFRPHPGLSGHFSDTGASPRELIPRCSWAQTWVVATEDVGHSGGAPRQQPDPGPGFPCGCEPLTSISL